MTMSRGLGILALTLSTGVALAPEARAEPLFDYVSTVSVATAPTLPSNPPGLGSAVIAIGAGNSLTFNTNAETGLDGGFPGGFSFELGRIVFNPSGDDSIVTFAVNFNYEVTITDQDSGESGAVNFTGLVSGTAQGGAFPLIFSSIADYNVAPQMFELGGKSYLVSAPGAIGPIRTFSLSIDGLLFGQVEVSVVIVPEPASISLIGLGGVGLLVLARRRPFRAAA